VAAGDVAWVKAAVEVEVGWDVSRRSCYEELSLGLLKGKMAESLEIRRQQLAFLAVEKVEEDRVEEVVAEEDHPGYSGQEMTMALIIMANVETVRHARAQGAEIVVTGMRILMMMTFMKILMAVVAALVDV